MKKSLMVVVAALVAMCQFGCDGSWKLAHDVVAHLVQLGSIADMFNVIP